MTVTRYLYIISSSLGYQKIGWSIDPDQRCRMLSAGHPVGLVIYKTWSHAAAPKVERKTHSLLAEFKSNGEWFAVDPATAETAVRKAIQAIDTYVVKPRPVRKYKSRTPQYGPMWTKERQDALGVMWQMGLATREIMEELNELSGAKLSMTRVCARAKELNLARPEDFIPSHVTGTWTEARRNILVDLYPKGVDPADILSALNALEGPAMEWLYVRSAAYKLGLRRPSDFQKRQIIRNATRPDARWTSERNEFLTQNYAAGMLPTDLLDGLLSLPGKDDLTWDIVRDRARSKKVKRPDGFFNSLRNAMFNGYIGVKR